MLSDRAARGDPHAEGARALKPHDSMVDVFSIPYGWIDSYLVNDFERDYVEVGPRALACEVWENDALYFDRFEVIVSRCVPELAAAAS